MVDRWDVRLMVLKVAFDMKIEKRKEERGKRK
jgi:hypothetical protein